MTNTFIGIDPGGSGAIVAIGDVEDGLMFIKCDSTEHDMWRFLENVSLMGDGAHFALIEKVGAMPAQGVSSTFKFGQSYGFLRGLLVSTGFPFDEITPQKWQKEYSLIRKSKTETNTQKKNRHKQKAQQLFPGVRINHANADALLIAEYCRRMNGEVLGGVEATS